MYLYIKYILSLTKSYFKKKIIIFYDIYLLGMAEQVAKAYLANKSIQVSVNSLWNVKSILSIGGFKSFIGLRLMPIAVRSCLRLP